MEFVILTEKEFTDFAEKHENKSFFQTTKIASIRDKNGWKPYYVGVKKPNKILAATMMVAKVTFAGHKTFYAPGGPLIDYEDETLLKFFVTELKKYLKKEGAYVFHIDPYYELIERDKDGKIVSSGFNHEKAAENLKKLGFKQMKISEQPKYLFVTDINGCTPEELLESFKGNTRNKISKTEKHGIKITELTKQDLTRFKKITEETSRRRGFHDKSLDYYETMYDLFKDQVKFVVAEIDLKDYKDRLTISLTSLEKELSSLDKELEQAEKALKNPDRDASKDNQQKKKIKRIENSKKPVQAAIADAKNRLEDAKNIKEDKLDLSAAMFVLYGDEIIYLFSGSYEEYMKFDAQYLIQWHMIKYAAEHGYKRYNFYGIQGLPDPKAKDYGVYEFKRGFGGRVVELLGSYELPISPLYKVHNSLSKAKGLIKR